MISPTGETAAFTGTEASTWAGHKQGKYATAQGNILAGPAVVADMITAFENTPGRLAFRLQAALEAGQAAGRHARHAVSRHPHREEGRRPVAQQ